MFLDELKSMVESNEGYKLVAHMHIHMHAYTIYLLFLAVSLCYVYVAEVKIWSGS